MNSTTAECEVTINNKLGLHARPAAEFVKQANRFRSEIWLITPAGRFSALSLIAVMRANLNEGATAHLVAEGLDAKEAIAQLARTLSRLPDKYD